MAEVDPVEIIVDIVDQFSDELRELRGELERIDAKSLNIDLDVQASSEIATTEAKLDAMARDRTVGIRTRVGGIPGGGGDGDGGIPVPSFDRPGGGRGNLMLGGRGAMRMIGRGGDAGAGGLRGMIPDDALERSRNSFSRLGSLMGRLTPNIMMVWNALAAGIPIMVSLGAAAIGLAGALGAVAAAGVGILGIGLLGFGDTFSQSISNATTELQNLGSTLFDVIQPVANTFQPILMGWLEGAPRQVQKLVGPMQNLAVFADVLGQAGAGFMDWTARVLNAMTGMDEIISQMVMRLGTVAGNFLIDWMQNMVQFAYDNQTALIQLAEVVRDLFGALLNISIVASSTLAQFSFLTDILVLVSNLLNTKLGRALVMVAALMVSLEAAVAGVLAVLGLAGKAMFSLSGGIISSYLPAVSSAIAATWTWIQGLSTLRAVLASTGIGLGLIAGGYLANEFLLSDPGPSGGAGTGGGGSMGGGTYINVQGDVGRRELDRILDETGGVAREEISITEDMQR